MKNISQQFEQLKDNAKNFLSDKDLMIVDSSLYDEDRSTYFDLISDDCNIYLDVYNKFSGDVNTYYLLSLKDNLMMLQDVGSEFEPIEVGVWDLTSDSLFDLVNELTIEITLNNC